jgi:hypothetical protein
LLGKHIHEGGDLVRLERVSECRHSVPPVMDLLCDGIFLQALANGEQRWSFVGYSNSAYAVTMLATFFMKERSSRRSIYGGSVDLGDGTPNSRACKEY